MHRVERWGYRRSQWLDTETCAARPVHKWLCVGRLVDRPRGRDVISKDRAVVIRVACIRQCSRVSIRTGVARPTLGRRCLKPDTVWVDQTPADRKGRRLAIAAGVETESLDPALDLFAILVERAGDSGDIA